MTQIVARLGSHTCLSADFTLQPGVAPSSGSCQISFDDIPPTFFLSSFRRYDLHLGDGRSNVRIRKLYVDSAKPNPGIDGRGYWEIRLLDRRWQWKYTYLNGHYNTLQGDGTTVEPSTTKTFRELVLLCLEAMGESGYELPDWTDAEIPAPTNVRWDFSNAAEELQKLCDRAKVLICLGTDSKVRLIFCSI